MIICQSGGARMQEAAYSLMQLAKVQSKLAQLSDKNYLTLPIYVTLLLEELPHLLQ
jgi:acetyl-CoA carboxylase beta subunit